MNSSSVIFWLWLSSWLSNLRALFTTVSPFILSFFYVPGCLTLPPAPQSECRRTVQLIMNAQDPFLWPECSESLKGCEREIDVWPFSRALCEVMSAGMWGRRRDLQVTGMNWPTCTHTKYPVEHIICNISQVLQGPGNGCCCHFNGLSYWMSGCQWVTQVITTSQCALQCVCVHLWGTLGMLSCMNVTISMCEVSRWENPHLSWYFQLSQLHVLTSICHCSCDRMPCRLHEDACCWNFASWLFCSLN